MAEDFRLALQELGLLPAEAHVYLALVRNGALSGTAVASVTGYPRSSVYLTLNSLLDKGLIEGGPGHGVAFSLFHLAKRFLRWSCRKRRQSLNVKRLRPTLGAASLPCWSPPKQ